MRRKFKKVSFLWKKHIVFNEKTRAFCKIEYEKYIGKDDRELGVLCRGSDYLKEQRKYLASQSSPMVVIEKVKKMKSKLNYSKIYLATEDKEIHDMFKKEFGDLLIDNEQPLVEWTAENKNKCLAEIDWNDKDSKINRGLKYISSMYILSRCRFFIGGITSGTVAAFMMRKKPYYEYEYIYIDWVYIKYR